MNQEALSREKFDELVKKIEEAKASGTVDLSMEEDLSIAVMNLISLEEHFFFTANKTGKGEYYDLLKDVREVRKEVLGRMIDKSQHEGETWCITKHLLAATMRLIEVGTKLKGDGKNEEAQKTFGEAYRVYSIFWGLRLKLIDIGSVKKIGESELNVHTAKKPPASAEASSGKWSTEDIVNKLVDCCDE